METNRNKQQTWWANRSSKQAPQLRLHLDAFEAWGPISSSWSLNPINWVTGAKQPVLLPHRATAELWRRHTILVDVNAVLKCAMERVEQTERTQAGFWCSFWLHLQLCMQISFNLSCVQDSASALVHTAEFDARASSSDSPPTRTHERILFQNIRNAYVR